MYFCLFDDAVTNGVDAAAAAAIRFAQQIFYSFQRGSNEEDWILSEPPGICMHVIQYICVNGRFRWHIIIYNMKKLSPNHHDDDLFG